MSEMDISMHDTRSDVEPGQYLHRNAREVRDHGGQADDVEKNGGFKEIGKMPCALSARFRFGFALVDTEIAG